MTPKEKAKDLVDKFSNEMLIDNYEAKRCALIAVDEMILVLSFTETNISLNYYAIFLQKYLEQVKEEIELL